jgi:hypothetical protein
MRQGKRLLKFWISFDQGKQKCLKRKKSDFAIWVSFGSVSSAVLASPLRAYLWPVQTSADGAKWA